MKNLTIKVVSGGVILLCLVTVVFSWKDQLATIHNQTVSPSPLALPTVTLVPTTETSLSPTQAASPVSQSSDEFALADPVTDFKARITKKFFGTYVTPQNSPVALERFTGYHTGVDVEYDDVKTDVPVQAIADGTVVLARFASGYGGVVVIRHTIENKQILVVYGHLDPSRLPKVGDTVKPGEQFAYLGQGYSHQTDSERKHLHFALLKGDKIDLKGYVQSKDQLTDWYNPLDFYK